MFINLKLNKFNEILFLLADDTQGLQLVTWDVYEIGVHVFLHGHTGS